MSARPSGTAAAARIVTADGSVNPAWAPGLEQSIVHRVTHVNVEVSTRRRASVFELPPCQEYGSRGLAEYELFVDVYGARSGTSLNVTSSR